MQARDYQKSASSFLDGFRDNVRTLYHVPESRRHNQPLPRCSRMAATSESLAHRVLERICRTSALWAQFGLLCDVIVVDKHKNRELPVAYVQESQLGQCPHSSIIPYEWESWTDASIAIRTTRRPSKAPFFTLSSGQARCRFAGACRTPRPGGSLRYVLPGAYHDRGRKHYHLEEHERPSPGFLPGRKRRCVESATVASYRKLEAITNDTTPIMATAPIQARRV